ncbi:MAG: hypothetical protein BKPUNTRY_001988 [Candidatus Fervidibacter sp.]
MIPKVRSCVRNINQTGCTGTDKQLLIFDIRQHGFFPLVTARPLFTGALHEPSMGMSFVVILGVLGDSKLNLPKVAATGTLPSLLASAREDGEQDRCQDRDYRDHHQQFNQREPRSPNERLIVQCLSAKPSRSEASLLFKVSRRPWERLLNLCHNSGDLNMLRGCSEREGEAPAEPNISAGRERAGRQRGSWAGRRNRLTGRFALPLAQFPNALTCCVKA